MTEREIKVFSSIELLNEFARNEIANLCAKAIAKHGQFTIALSGGSTPQKLYALLAEENFQSQINWLKTRFFFGDERFVAPDSDESNFQMARETLFSKIKIPQENIHLFLTEEGNAKTVAEKMENELREFFHLKENEFPRFDLILLGMGADAHTASLFPATSALKETKRLVTENYVEKFEAFRLTFTLPTINHARNIFFIIAGEDKAKAVREVLQGEYNPEKFPAQFIKPENGKLLFLLDAKAARFL